VDLTELDPELREPYRRLPATPLGLPGVAPLTNLGMRALLRDAVAGWKALLGAEPGGADAPEYAVAARRDDLSGLCATWIGIGEIDLFHDEDAAYAERLRAAGVEVTFETVPHAPHGFESIAPGTALVTRYLRDARAWLAHALRR
jgi:acetyl esterase/lipase